MSHAGGPERSDALEVMRSPRGVDVEITSRCNLRCRYCYFFDNPGAVYGELPTGEWLRFFEELGRAGVMSVCLSGGEPFLRGDLPELVAGIVRNRMRFSLLSNGSAITDGIARTMSESRRCDCVQVSVDGASAEVHDSFRGRGSFEAAVRGIRTLQRHGVPVTVRVTVHRRNVRHLEEIAGFLLDDLHLPEFGTNAASYFGSCRGQREHVMLTAPERQRAMEALLRLAEVYPTRITAAAGPLAEGRMWREMEEARAAGKEESPGRGRLTGCGCTSSKIAVRSDGAYVPCTMLPHLALGRINRDDLLEVWRHSAVLEGMRRRSEIPLRSFEPCRGCEYAPYCTGNCPGTAYTVTGELDQPAPDACLRRFLDAGGRVPQ